MPTVTPEPPSTDPMLPPEAMGSQFRGAAPVILFGILVLATIGGVFFLLC